MAEEVGLDGARPYDLRHAFASLLIHEGRLSVVDIAAQLGHNPTVCLDTYAHVMAEQRGAEPVSAAEQIAVARRDAGFTPTTRQASSSPSGTLTSELDRFALFEARGLAWDSLALQGAQSTSAPSHRAIMSVDLRTNLSLESEDRVNDAGQGIAQLVHGCPHLTAASERAFRVGVLQKLTRVAPGDEAGCYLVLEMPVQGESSPAAGRLGSVRTRNIEPELLGSAPPRPRVVC